MKSFFLSCLFLIYFSGIAFAGYQECLEGKEAFKDSLFHLARTSCFKCHDGVSKPGMKKGPGFASGDLNRAYTIALQYSNFEFPEESDFAVNVGDRHWEKYDPEQKGASQDEVIAALKTWDELGQIKCLDRNLHRLNSQKIQLQPTVTSPVAKVQMRWKIEHEGGPENVAAELTVLREMDITAKPPVIKPVVKIKDLKLASHQDIIPGKMHLIINGTLIGTHLNIGAGLRAVWGHEFSFADEFWPFARIQQRELLLPMPVEEETLELQLAYDQIEVKEIKNECPKSDLFSSKVRPVVHQLCVGCHNENAKTGAMRLQVGEQGVNSDCRALQSYLWTSSLALSELVEYPIGGKAGHVVLSFSDQRKLRAALDEWVKNFNQ